jgi:hypothetical protein
MTVDNTIITLMCSSVNQHFNITDAQETMGIMFESTRNLSIDRAAKGPNAVAERHDDLSTVSILPRVPAASLRGSREGQEEGRGGGLYRGAVGVFSFAPSANYSQ